MHVIIFLWGFTGILGKLIHKDFLHIVWYRVLIACVALGIFLLLSSKSLSVSRKDLPKIIGVGIIVALHWMSFYWAIQLSTASLAILCLSTTTLHVTWLEPLVMKRKFSWREFIMGLLVIVGIDTFNILEAYSLLKQTACLASFNETIHDINILSTQDKSL
jgi:drug/metabolite transporter (DMT)-like permease